MKTEYFLFVMCASMLCFVSKEDLHPNQNTLYKDSRIKPADLVHLGYALAYDVDFFITTDRILRGYSIPKEFKTKVLHPHEAQAILK